MRTNIDIDDALMKQAMKATGAKTKKAAVEAALCRLIEVHDYEKKMDEIFRKQEIARRAAEREGRLEEWYSDLVRNGNCREV